jgi:hypothetical protein
MFANDQDHRWEDGVPSDLIPAIEHLRELFDRSHFHFGFVTKKLCYAHLHGQFCPDTCKEDVETLQKLTAYVPPAARDRFNRVIREATPPGIFKAFFDFYVDGMRVQAQLTFKEMLEIGHANEHRLSAGQVEWAKSQTQSLIRAHRHCIKMWVRDVCDEYEHRHGTDFLESYWSEWRAPQFLVMHPSRYGTYDANRVWERSDAETSVKWLEAFADDYVIRLETEVDNAAGVTLLKLAKQPKTGSGANLAASENFRVGPEEGKEFKVSQTFNVSGSNARINIGSTDVSTNVVHQHTPFSEVREAIESGVADGVERAELLQRLAELERAKDGKSAMERYQAFVTTAANHMTILAPLLPALGHWVHNLAASI